MILIAGYNGEGQDHCVGMGGALVAVRGGIDLVSHYEPFHGN